MSIYAKEIIEYLREREKEFRISEYLEYQEDMDSVMRQSIVEWMIKIVQFYRMKKQVLFLAVHLLDKFLENNLNVKRTEL